MKAKDKKAALGVDVTIENFTDEDKFAYELIDDMNDVSKKTKESLLKVGIDTDEKGRAGSFLQVDQTNVFTNNSISNNVDCCLSS